MGPLFFALSVEKNQWLEYNKFMQYKSEGIIIRRRNFGEADRLLTIYTQKKGKITAIAKGARKIKSKLAGHLELFYLSNLMIAEGKNISTITGAQTINNYSYLRNNLKYLNKAYYLAEILDKMTEENENNQELFNLIQEILAKIDDNPLFLSYFNLQILKILGHTPELSFCVCCHKKLDQKEINFFSAKFGGIICIECQNNDLQRKNVSASEIKILRLLSDNKINIIKQIKPLSDNAANTIEWFLEFVMEREIKSKRAFFS